jgi:hypothetical protein
MDADAFRDPPLAARPRQRLIELRRHAGNAPAVAHAASPLTDIARLRALGFGAVTLQLAAEDYLDTEAGWAALREQLAEVRAQGMTAYIRDERGRPSGKAAGKAVAAFPEGAARGLAHVSQPFEGPCKASVALPQGRLIYAAALPREANTLRLNAARDLRATAAGGAIRAALPAGQWVIVALVERTVLDGTFAADPTAGPEPYINILDRRAVAAWIAVCHDPHAARLADFLGSVVKGFHSDEPLLITTAFPSGKPFSPWPMLPWTAELPAFFAAQAGYPLDSCLPALFHDCGADTASIRVAFWRCIGALCGDAFRAQLGEWHRAKGLAHKLQTLGEESFVTQTAFNGSPSLFVGDAALPCADILSVTPETFRSRDQCIPAARMISSAALHQGVRELEIDLADAYQYRAGLRTTRDQLRATIAFTHVMGGTALHSLCAWKERDDEDWRELTAFAARLRLALAASDHVADIALVTPECSVWANYVPGTGYIMEPPIGGLDRPRIWSETYAPAASRWDIAFRDLFWTLIEAQRDVGIVAEHELSRARFVDGRAELGAASYRALVMPPADTADPDSFLIMRRFAETGGTCFAFHPWPHRNARPGGEAREAAIALFGEEVPPPRGFRASVVGEGKVVLVGDTAGLLAAMDALLPPGASIAPPSSLLLVMNRRQARGDRWLVVNLATSTFVGHLRLRESPDVLLLCDPLTGLTVRTPRQSDGYPVSIPASGAMILAAA